MNYTVGLDFGTHQTKVCIEDSSNPLQKIYNFFEFVDSKGQLTVLFPSIVQINDDDTLSYGFIEDTRCKTIINKETEKPRLKLPSEPHLTLPKEPDNPNKKTIREGLKGLSIKDQLRFIYHNIKTKHHNELQYKIEFKEWESNCKLAKEVFLNKKKNWEKNKDELIVAHQRDVLYWEKNNVFKHQYRYFKQAIYTDTITWSHKILPEVISVWYIAYIILLLKEKYGPNYFTQMGVPSGLEKEIFSKQKTKAYSLFIAANKLVESYKTKEVFLKEKYSNLLEVTNIDHNITKEDFDNCYLEILPEAYAGLLSITQQRRIEPGISLLIDIGGGTTDVVLFTITNDKLPNIHAVVSFPKGLNYIFENYIKRNKELTLWELQRFFLVERDKLKNMDSSIEEYHNQLKQNVKEMLITLYKNFSRTSINPVNLKKALENRAVLFCGGGAIYNEMRPLVMDTSHNMLIEKNLLNIPSINNRNLEDKLYTILATSYGLCIPLENDIVLTPIQNMFDHIQKNDHNKREHNYEHGLTDY